MRTIKILATIALAAFLSASASAQAPKKGGDKPQKGEKTENVDKDARKHQMKEEWREKMESARVAFLTSELDLTVQEAEVFWPVYNDIQKEQRAAFKDVMAAKMALGKALKDGTPANEIDVLLNSYIQAKEDVQAIESQSVDKYRKVLPAEKVAKLFLAEEKFKNRQIRDLGNHDGRPGGQRPEGGQRPGGQRPPRMMDFED